MSKKERNARKALFTKQVEFTPLASRIAEFVAQNRKKLYGGLAGIIIVGLMVFGFLYHSRVSENKAYALFEQGLTIRQNAETGKEVTTTDEIRINDFDEVLKKYPKTEAARLTLLTYGDYHYKNGSYDKAIELYLQALKASNDYPLIKAFILNSIGYCYEEKKDYKTAAEYFLKIIGQENGILKDTAHFNLGRICEAMGDMPAALDHYDKVVKEYPESIYSQMAKHKTG